MSSPITVTCPHCQKSLLANPEFVGKRARCPGCSQAIVISATQELYAPPAPTTLTPTPPQAPTAQSLATPLPVSYQPHSGASRSKPSVQNKSISSGMIIAIAMISLVSIAVLGGIGYWILLPKMPEQTVAKQEGNDSKAEAPPVNTFDFENSIGMRFKKLPSGSLMMGSEKGHANERPIHRVDLSNGFALGIFEVTQQQYERVIGTNPSKVKAPRYPVAMVNSFEAMEFCKKLSALPEEKAADRYYRLPTEAEWEYACRAGTTTEFCCADEQSLTSHAWFKENSGGRSHPVGEKEPNAWGFYDMHGNVQEWCQDWWLRKYASKSVTDPTGPNSGGARIYRGGSYRTEASKCRSAYRYGYGPAGQFSTVGFRVACVPLSQAPPPTKLKIKASAPESFARSVAPVYKGPESFDNIVLSELPAYQAATDKPGFEKWFNYQKSTLEKSPSKKGFLVTGCVELEDGGDPQFVNSQDTIRPDGTFAHVMRSLQRPFGLRAHGFEPVDVRLNQCQGTVVDVGKIKLKKLPPQDLKQLIGKVLLDDEETSGTATVELKIHTGPVNPFGGTRPFGGERLKLKVPLNKPLNLEGFSPAIYYGNVIVPGFVPYLIKPDFRGAKADLGTITLKRQLEVHFEYLISASGTKFDPSSEPNNASSKGGEFTEINNRVFWQLMQEDGKLQFRSASVRVSYRDLGPGTLAKFIDTEKVTEDLSRRLPVVEGNVYLIHDGYRKTHYLLRVKRIEPASIKAAR